MFWTPYYIYFFVNTKHCVVELLTVYIQIYGCPEQQKASPATRGFDLFMILRQDEETGNKALARGSEWKIHSDVGREPSARISK